MGHLVSLALVVFAEFSCSLLLIAGLVTRVATLVLSLNLSVAFIGVPKAVLCGAHSGELAFI